MADLSRRQALRITAVAGVSTAFGGGLIRTLVNEAGLHRVRESRPAMGTVVTLTVLHPEPGAAREMVRSAFDEMKRLEGILTRHDQAGGVARLNRNGVLHAAPLELLHVLDAARVVSERTDGAFDVTALPLLEVMERAFAERGAPPSDEEVRTARRHVDYRGIEVDGRTISLRPGARITLDGVAKGFIVDRTRDLLSRMGAERILVDAGGDMSASEGDRSLAPWTVAIQNPESEDAAELLHLRDGSVATSGDYMRTFTLDRRHHHILDPRTGRSARGGASVSVLHGSAMWADAFSTAHMVLGPGEGREVHRRDADHEVLWILSDGRRVETAGFHARARAT